MSIKAVIIEDEPNNLLLLSHLLNDCSPEVNIVGDAGSVDSAVKLLKEHEVDLVFLDIQIKGGTGFDVLTQLGKRRFEVIFTTAYAQYAIDAIKKKAFDYLLKPVKKGELQNAISDFTEKRSQEQHSGNEDSFLVQQDTSFLIKKTQRGQKAIPLKDILYFLANGSYTEVVLKNRKLLISKNIGEIEKRLPFNLFFRTHHSCIVNVSHIKRVEVKRSGFVEMDNGESLPVSQRKKKDFLNFMEKLSNLD